MKEREREREEGEKSSDMESKKVQYHHIDFARTNTFVDFCKAISNARVLQRP